MIWGMKTLVTKVTERGQTSIPAEIRTRLALKPGMSIVWEQREGTFSCIVSVVQHPQRRDARSMLGFARRFRKTRTTAEWMAELREGERE